MVTGLILAAGAGKRFGSEKPKQFCILNKRPVLFYTIKAFVDAKCCDNIVLVLSKPFFSLGKKIIKAFPNAQKQIHICEGGETRQDSVYLGVLKAIELNDNNPKGIKIISHCGARPALPKSIILENLAKISPRRCVNTVRKVFDTLIYKALDKALDKDSDTASDTLANKVSEENFNFIDRDKTFAVLTPQSFFAEDYITAYLPVRDRIGQYTCVCSVMTSYGFGMDLIVSDYPIKKITVKSDINVVKHDLKDLCE